MTKADPEYLKIKEEFLDSLDQRSKALHAVISQIRSAQINPGLKSGGMTESLFNQGYRIVHSLAGVAGTFGFKALSAVSEKLDDLLSLEEVQSDPQMHPRVLTWMQFVEEVLISAARKRQDPVEFLSDSRLKEITSVFESLSDSASSESS